MMINNIKDIFPILSQKINGNKLIYLDNAASTQKPIQIIESINEYYKKFNSNVHRGVHHLSQIATQEYENARSKVHKFINSKYSEEIIFTKGTTDSLNLIANVIKKEINEGDEIILSIAEHHSNIVPWQIIAKEKKAVLKYILLDKKQNLDYNHFISLLSSRTKIVSIQDISNALGNINPIENIIKEARKYNPIIIIDAAQSLAHKKMDVQKLDCDFLCFSGHKMYSSTGIGVLYGKKNILENLPPYQFGGDMIKEVFLDYSTYADLPLKYEAGTPNIEGAITLAKAIDFISEIGIKNIEKHENNLYDYSINRLSEIKDIIIYGGENKTSSISFNIEGIHNFDLGVLLDQMGIATRTGHHCCQPLMRYLNISGTVRISFAVYNTTKELDYLIKCIEKAVSLLKNTIPSV